MRILIALIITCLSLTGVNSQTFDPIKWTSGVIKNSDTVYTLYFEATLDKGWHLYSQRVADTDEIAPTPTEFTFTMLPERFQLIGETVEPDGIEKFDKIFEMDIKYFENKARFTQKIKLLDPTLNTISAEVFFAICDDVRCLAPDTVVFELTLNPGDTVVTSEKNTVNLTDADIEKSNALQLDLKKKDAFLQDTTEDKSYLSIFILGF